ncbi:MAG: universal stress protein [Myxococcales bacterium]|nr:universal stress protein [Myxococcales bacterium]
MPIQKILVATDFSEHAEEAAKLSGILQSACGSARRLIHVVSPSDATEDLTEYAEADVQVVSDGSPPAAAICREATSWGADLVAMGTHGHSAVELDLMGSVAEKVVRASPVPVLTVQKGQGWSSGEELQKILVPIDFSKGAHAAALLASDIARCFSAEVELLHVLELAPPSFLRAPIPAPYLEEAQDGARLELVNELGKLEDTGVKVSLHIAAAKAAPAILARCEEIGADLVILGSRGWTSFRSFLLGSVASRVVRHATVPVITCREPF